MEVLLLLRTVFESILQVFLICFAGWLVARRGILDKKTQKQVNRLNVLLFTPALLFSKVAFFLTPDKLRELWVIPIIFFAVTLVSGLVAWAFARIWQLKRSQRAFAIAASMFMNSNSLPIALLQSIVVTVHGLEWGPGDTRNGMLGRALTYLIIYSTLGLMLRWSYGVHLLAQADEATPDATEGSLIPSSTSEDGERSPLLGRGTTSPVPKNYSSATLRSEGPTLPLSITYTSDDDEGLSIHDAPIHSQNLDTSHDLVVNQRTFSSSRPIRQHNNPQSHFFYSFPNTPRMSGAVLPSDSAPELEHTNNRSWEKIKAGMHKVNGFMTPPMWAALASLTVACIRPIQHALEVHLSPVKSALTSAGNCSIPLTLLVLGGYFHAGKDGAMEPNLPQDQARDNGEEDDTRPGEEGDDDGLRELVRPRSDSTLVGTWGRAWKGMRVKVSMTTPKRAGTRTGETATVFVAIMSRMIVTPLLLMPACAALAKYATHNVFDDPVFIVSNVLLISSPPALTLAQITQAVSGDAFERLLSRTIFWSYCVLTPITTMVYVVLGLWLTRL